MKRTYLPIADFSVYNNLVDDLLIHSSILNGGSEIVPNLHSVIWTRDNLEGHLAEIEGNENGEYLKNGAGAVAVIPYLQSKIREIEKRFTEYKDLQVKQGYSMPEVMPNQMLNEFYLLKAQLTVLQAEADELRKRLQVCKDEEQKEEDSKVLQYGLVGWASFHTDPRLLNILKVIDGQRITLTEEGLLIINDKRSPYSGMAVADYRALCKTFYNQQQQKEKENFKQFQEQCKAEGKPIPRQEPARAPRKVSRASLPPWPAGVKNWLAKNEAPIHMIRK
jgi:hypothetical protein